MYPINFDVEYGTGERQRGLAVLGILWFLKGLLLIPHLIVLAFLGIAASVVGWFGYFVIAFTGELPEGMSRYMTQVVTWSNRTSAWLYSTTDEYPPFAFDAPSYPARTTVNDGSGPRSRGWAVLGIFFIKVLAALPHLVVVSVLSWAASVASWFGYWIIAFTGKLPEGLHTFVVGVLRWNTRTIGWIASLTDQYPPFSLE
jgi:hypothetical protein